MPLGEHPCLERGDASLVPLYNKQEQHKCTRKGINKCVEMKPSTKEQTFAFLLTIHQHIDKQTSRHIATPLYRHIDTSTHRQVVKDDHSCLS